MDKNVERQKRRIILNQSHADFIANYAAYVPVSAFDGVGGKQTNKGANEKHVTHEKSRINSNNNIFDVLYSLWR